MSIRIRQPFTRRRFLKTSAAAGILAILYIFGAWRCAVGLRSVNPHWLMIALLVSWVGDSAAYYVGRAFGKRKMAVRGRLN